MSEKLRIKIWETLFEHGLGSLLKPWQFKREELAKAKALRQSRLLEEKTNIDLALLKEGNINVDEDGKVTYLPPIVNESHSLIEAINYSEKINILERKINLLNVILQAERIASKSEEKEISGHVTYEWFQHWQENAEKIKNDDLKILWAKVLCKESTEEGSVSLRTLDFLRCISHDEAFQIEQLAKLQKSSMIVRCYGHFLIDKEERIIPKSYTDNFFFDMQDLGIISNVNELGVSYELKDFGDETVTKYKISFKKDCYIATCKKRDNAELVNGYNISKIGIELFDIVDVEVDAEYCSNILERFKNKGYQLIKEESN